MDNKPEFALVLVGGGNMGGAMLAGWLADGFDPASVTVIDPSPCRAVRELIDRQGLNHFAQAPREPAADVLVLAVKPQVMDTVLAGVRHLSGAGRVAISVAAGITLRRLAAGLAKDTAIVRAMPNTPALVRRGITVACGNARLGAVERGRADRVLAATGKLEWIEDESLMDAVTAVSGSGPAYVFHLTECLAQAGVKAGLPAELAARLARETVSGAGELMRLSQEGPDQLRRNVTSPNGTTAAALEVLGGERGLRQLMERAVEAAKRRSRELSG